MKKRSLTLSGLAPLVAITSLFVLSSCNDSGGEAEVSESSAVETTATANEDAYPLTTCVVSGEDLGSMGEPVVIDHEGTTVKFCCKSCIDDFNAEPAKYVAKLKQ